MRLYWYGMEQVVLQVAISQNATQDPDTLLWTSEDPTKDSILVEMLDSASNQGYIIIRHANKTGGTITWTDIFRINHDGTIIFDKVTSLPDAPAADQIKLFADLFLGRLQPKARTASETINILQGDGLGKLWYAQDGSFPIGAKRGDVLFKPGVGKRYASIFAEDNATATTIGSANTWYQITVFDTNGESNGATPDHTNDHITIDHTGVYLILLSSSILTGGASAATYECEVRKNNGATAYPNIHWDRRLPGGGTDVGSASGHGIELLTEDDTIEVWVQNKTNTTDIIFEDITLSVIEIK